MEDMTFTVSEFLRHLLHLRRRGIITGDEPLVDMGLFGISHLQVESSVDGNAFVMLCSMEAEEAELKMGSFYDKKS
jgi:hypothetical protein